MATDVQQVNDNLRDFYDFSAKSVIHVGAGGGRLLDYAQDSESVLAIDCDEHAVRQLEAVVKSRDLKNVIVQNTDFFDLDTTADVVLFEFCLHEIVDPLKALRKAVEMAKDVVVIDHAADSPWAWYTGETEKVRSSWSFVASFNVTREKTHDAVQRFNDFRELFEKVEVLGQPSLDRISIFKDKTDIEIGMGYRFALITHKRLSGSP